MTREVEKAQDLGPSTMTTVAELLDAWWPVARTNLSPSTVRNQTALIESIIKPRIGPVPLARLDVGALDRLYARLSAEGGARGGPLAPASVRRFHSVVSAALGRAVKWGWTSRNPAADATPPALAAREIQAPEPAQVAAIIEESPVVNPGLPLFFRLAAVTGARRSELFALRRSDIDVANGALRVAHGVVIGPDRARAFKDTKTHAARRFALDETTLRALSRHRKDQAKVAAAIGTPLAGDPFVFTHTADGSECWSPEYPSRAFDRIKHRLGYPTIRLHDLRHFTATRMLANGTDIRKVAGRLGHRNVAVTLNTYSHFVPAADRDAAEHLGQLI